jgi:hypothetical protein
VFGSRNIPWPESVERVAVAFAGPIALRLVENVFEKGFEARKACSILPFIVSFWSMTCRKVTHTVHMVRLVESQRKSPVLP